jgi:hypothetical protein
MTQLIFKKDLEQNKLEALLEFLKTWNIEAEIKISTPKKGNKQPNFSMASGIWKDYTIEANELRKNAWSR